MTTEEEARDYFSKVEQRAQEEQNKADALQEQRNRRFSTIMQQMKNAIHEDTKQQLAQEIHASVPGVSDDFLEAEVDLRLTEILRPYALEKLKEEESKKPKVTFDFGCKNCNECNPTAQKNSFEMSPEQLREMGDRAQIAKEALYSMENLDSMITDIEKLRAANTFDIIALIPLFTSVNSKINSHNRGTEVFFHNTGHKLATFPPVPSHPHERFTWFLKVQSQEILSDELLQSTRMTLLRFTQ